MSALARYDHDIVDDVCVVHLVGEVDTSNATTLRAELVQLVPNSALGLVLDLGDVRYLDSAGVHLLFGLDRDLRIRRQQLWLVLPPDAMIRRVLTLAKLDGAVPVVETSGEAIAQIREAG